MLARRMLWLGMSMIVLGALAPRAAYPAAAQPTYESLLEKARRGDPGLDFTALRMAWADRQAKLAKLNAADPELRNKMFDALHKDQLAAVIETGNQVLAQNFLDVDAHMFVAFAYEKSHEAEKAALHRTMGNGLMKSILASGNGRALETAFVVISVDEEYAVLRHYRLAPDKQDLVTTGGHHYDVLRARTDTHEEATVYFNIDKVVAIEDAHLSGH
ncbi:MAG TPA: DUF4919 domain-containing protein [Thermoanaerobaculia bacterium]|nr:DUF4919 domain-containing protein [Thermoanaerobaculia bacterium]